ncbi:MAG: potassium/proton antiporter [Peptostreptococcaceae bacterium]|nr:potassium/proton antiporter [Peptostreptococcaceae bacterium]
MTELMIISGLVLIICITSTKVLYKFGVPMLFIFIVLGMLFGSDGLVGIHFDDFELTKHLCSLGLVFIMFYGGFGTKWKLAKPVATPSILMSSLGVIITAGLTGLFCHLVVKTSILEGLLIGAIVASTDAASVFAVLRAQKLNLKGSLASLLEVESGSNDPIAYMSTLIILSMMKNGGALSLNTVVPLVVKQILFGLSIGLLLAKITVLILRHANFEIEGFYAILVTAIAILSYSLSEFLGGNGYLSVYITGIIIGNSKIPKKKSMFHFFDGISWIMQIGLFFILGLLSFPSKIPYVTGTAISISLFMIFIARPLATFLILSPFKFTVKEKLLISWVGLRGAASVVFAIFAVTYGVAIENDIFHIIFFIALFSVVIQGTLIPTVANKLGLVDNEEPGSVLKTFTDYTEEINSELLEFTITEESNLKNKMIMDANIPEEILIVMIKRGNQVLVPKGSVLIKEGDKLVLSGNNIERLIEETMI